MATADDVDGQLVLEAGEGPALGVPAARYAYEVRDGWLWVNYRDDVPFVPYLGWHLPAEFNALAEMHNLPYTVELSYGMHEGQPRLGSVKFIPEQRYRTIVPTASGSVAGQLFFGERTEVTSEGLRKIPIRRLQQLAVLAAVHAEPRAGGQHPLEDWADLYAKRLPDTPAKRSPRKRLGDEHYRRVAEIYRDAFKNPTAAVMAQMHASRSTAGRWVMEARRRGFLRPTRPGQAGEASTNRRATKERGR